MNTQQLKLAALAATLAAFTAGCATYTGQTDDPNDPNRTRNGALIGAAIGAAAGLLSGDSAVERRQHAMIGVGIGALAGGGIGAYQDRQEAELRRATAGTGVDVTRDGDVIKLNLPDGVTFDFAKSDIKPQFYPALTTIANTLREYNQTIVEVSGHTDSVGSDAANQTLSERRANAVSGYLVSQGLQRERFEVVGMGERYPIASNDTDQGRALNRRVEIRLLPLES
jgi:outer membrane protein OmpA-like peptidoglycan-associated protein